MYHILLIDDERDTLACFSAFLQQKGCTTFCAQTSKQAMLLAAQQPLDCILLDVMLSETTGFVLYDYLRDVNTAPIVFLSNRVDVESQIQGFSKGGADYIFKDCDQQLFWLKVKSHIENSQKSRKESMITHSPLSINLKSRSAFLNDIQLDLTNIEFDILALIAQKPDYIWSLQEIYHHVWGGDISDASQMIQAHISRLRRKMEKAYSRHYFIETVWGKGYQFVCMS